MLLVMGEDVIREAFKNTLHSVTHILAVTAEHAMPISCTRRSDDHASQGNAQCYLLADNHR